MFQLPFEPRFARTVVGTALFALGLMVALANLQGTDSQPDAAVPRTVNALDHPDERSAAEAGVLLAPERVGGPMTGISMPDGQREGAERRALVERLATALAGDPGESLEAALGELTRQCGGTHRSPCLDSVMSQLHAPAQRMLRDILDRLPRLADRLSSSVQSINSPLLDRIEVISRVRADVLGADNARRLYGLQEARLRAEAQVDQFMRAQALTLPVPQRLATAEVLRAKELQGHPTPALDDPNELARRYTTSLQLTLLGVADPAERDRLARQVRSQFFDAAEVERLSQNDLFDAIQLQRIESFGSSRAAIQARYASTKDPAAIKQRELELDALKRQMFPDSYPSR